MKKIFIALFSIFLIFSSMNFVSSKQISHIDTLDKSEVAVDSSNINNVRERQVMPNINRLNGFFTENRGQVGNDSVRYYIQGKGVWFLDDGVVFEIQEPMKDIEEQRDPFDRFHPEFEPEKPQPRKSVVIKLIFDGCNEVEPKGVGLLPHRSNYFYGNDSSKWCTDVPNYQEIIYERIYKNIDLRYYSSNKGLKYDFIVHLGGDPTEIRMNYEGIDYLKIDDNGNLIIKIENVDIIDRNLFIYQDHGNCQKIIKGKFKIYDNIKFGFEILDNYNTEKILVIDPLLYFSTFVGGNDTDLSYNFEIDSIGNTYVVGTTESYDFPTTNGAFDNTHNGGPSSPLSPYDCFVFKMNNNGTDLIFSTYIGGNKQDYGRDIAIDMDGNIYVAGETKSPNFPVTLGAYSTTFNLNYSNNQDGYVLKLNQTGSSLEYCTYIGGYKKEYAFAITIDTNRNVYITGATGSPDFPTTPLVYDTTLNGIQDAFVLKLDPTGSTLLFSTFIGGNSYEFGTDIIIDSQGNVFVLGQVSSQDFPTTNGAYNQVFNGGGTDVFLVKLNQIGSFLLYSTYIGGNNYEASGRFDRDSNGKVYITGQTNSSNFPTTLGAFDKSYNGSYDGFVLKLNLISSTLEYSTYIGGNDYENAIGIKIDDQDCAFVTGATDSIDFPTTSNAYDQTFNGVRDVFILKLNHNGSSLEYSSYIGGTDEDFGLDLDFNSENIIYLTGFTASLDFPITQGAHDTSHEGPRDCFVVKLKTFDDKVPIVNDLIISEPSIFRTNSIYLFSNATDFEDIEKNLTPHFEYRDQNEHVWNNSYFSTLQYQNLRWEVSFTPPKNAVLGLYDFRVRFNDTFPEFSNWFFLNDSLMVLNNIPKLENINLSNNFAILGDIISIWINCSDIEEIEENLTIELEYQDPTEQSWDTKYLNTFQYVNDRWEFTITIPFEAQFGYYDFRARCNDSDGNYSAWLYLNDSLQVYNIGPNVIDMKLSESSIYRTESVFLYVNGTDHETPEEMLTFHVQSKPKSGEEWINLTGEYLNNTLEVSFITNIESILGFYDFRAKFEDNESVSSGWVYLNDSLEVLNNPPIISEELDNIMVGFEPKIIDLTQYEFDIEDSNANLVWSVKNQKYLFLESVSIIDAGNDLLEIVPMENYTEEVDIELILTDKDGGIATKADITIHIDSRKYGLIPQVTLLTPPDGSIINTLTPLLTWEVNYTGTEIITYSVILDENPEPAKEIKTELTTTQYQIENELVDGMTYYWKVIPKNGECLSKAFSFKVDLSYELAYKVNLTAVEEFITLFQSDSKNITLKIINEGNNVDSYIIYFESNEFAFSNIEFSKVYLTLNASDEEDIEVMITIPENTKLGEYNIVFMAKSDKTSDNATITITVQEKRSEDEDKKEESTIIFIAISVIVIILIVISIVLFLYIRKKREEEYLRKIKEEQVEEEQPPETPLPKEPLHQEELTSKVVTQVLQVGQPPQVTPIPEVIPQVEEPAQPMTATQVEQNLRSGLKPQLELQELTMVQSEQSIQEPSRHVVTTQVPLAVQPKQE